MPSSSSWISFGQATGCFAIRTSSALPSHVHTKRTPTRFSGFALLSSASGPCLKSIRQKVQVLPAPLPFQLFMDEDSPWPHFGNITSELSSWWGLILEASQAVLLIARILLISLERIPAPLVSDHPGLPSARIVSWFRNQLTLAVSAKVLFYPLSPLTLLHCYKS